LNFTWILRALARRFPDRDAVATDDGTESFADFWRAIVATGSLYRQLGLARGDRVLLVLPNGRDFLHFHFGALQSGVVSVPVRTDYTGWEVRRIAANCEPRLVVGTAEWLDRNLGAMDLPPDVPVYCVESLRDRRPAGDDGVEPTGNGAIASINYSYFGDGYPKGAMLTHANHIYAATGYARHQGFTAADRVLVILPMSHVYALSGCVNAGLVRGAALIPSTSNTPGKILRDVERHRITVLSTVPAMFELIAGYRRKNRHDLSSLRRLVTGGAFMSAERQRKFQEAIGVEMVQGYGLTECLPVICNPPGSGNRPGTLGVPGRRDIFIRIVSRDGRVLPPGVTGEIQIRSVTTMAGYYRMPRDTERIFDGDWLRTGDIGALDEEGYLQFLGMSKPIYNVYGNKLDPVELRQVLLEHPAVAAVEVSLDAEPHTTVPDDPHVRARVFPRLHANISAPELRDFCRERLASYKIPRTILVEAAQAEQPAASP
jgi:acyl-CoA synthetase (AMP-forming)/AMP-acid ligase II